MRPGRRTAAGSGGWELDDVQARHRQYPETFWLPAVEDLVRLAPGHHARLIFRLVDQADPLRDDLTPYDDDGQPNLVTWHERMWLWVEGTGEEELVGVLMNLPVSSHTALTIGARVRFRKTDVIDLELEPPDSMHDELERLADIGFPVLTIEQGLEPVDPARRREVSEGQQLVCDAAGVMPERPLPIAQAIAAPSVRDQSAWPIYGGRFSPDRERDDCGWVVWTAEPDMGVAAEREKFEVVHFGSLHKTRAWRFLALPPGWAFVVGPDGSDDVYFDPELLAPDPDAAAGERQHDP